MTTSAQITKDTAETISRFNDAFQRRDRAGLAAVVHRCRPSRHPTARRMWGRTRAWRSGQS